MICGGNGGKFVGSLGLWLSALGPLGNVVKEKPTWPSQSRAGRRRKEGGGSLAAWELVQYLGALEQFVT